MDKGYMAQFLVHSVHVIHIHCMFRDVTGTIYYKTN